MSEAAFGVLALAFVLLAMTAAWVWVRYRQLELDQRKQAHEEKRLEAAITQHAAAVEAQKQSMYGTGQRSPLAS